MGATTQAHGEMTYCPTRRRMLVGLCRMSLLACCTPACASDTPPIRVCQDSQPHPPFLFPDHDGSIQILLRMTAARMGVALDTHYAPILRCQAELESGDSHARVASVTPNTLKTLAFPLSGNNVDVSRAVASVRHMLFRPTRNDTDWDGESFSNLRLPILIPPGYPQSRQELLRLGVQYDESGRDTETNFSKLLAGRGALAVALEEDGKSQLLKPQFAGKIEMLAVPLAQVHYFFAFSLHFYRSQPKFVETFWNELKLTRESEDYRRAIQSLS